MATFFFALLHILGPIPGRTHGASKPTWNACNPERLRPETAYDTPGAVTGGARHLQKTRVRSNPLRLLRPPGASKIYGLATGK